MIDSRKHLLYRLVLITVLLLAVYGNTINHRFVWDDTDVIVDNPMLEKLSNIPKFFLSEDRIEGATGYYRPITYVSFAIDRAIWGLNPVGFNITNLLLQIAATMLFFRVVTALFKNEHLAFVATLFFSLHPIAGETVNFHAGGRNTLLCACFALLSLLFYIKRKNIPAILCFTIAIFSKEFALLLPAIFLLYDMYLRNEKNRWPNYIPYVLSAILYLTLRSFAVEKANFIKTVNLSDSLLMAPYIVLKYLFNMALPFKLKVLYDVNSLIDIYTKLLYLFLLIAIIGAAVVFRKHKEIVFAVFWFLLFMLPVTNIIPLGETIMADRYAYFSLMGFGMAVAYLTNKINNRIAVPLLIGVCICYALVGFQRNQLWQDNLSLYTRMTKDAPGKSIGFHNLGIYYLISGDLAHAEMYLTEAYSKKGATVKSFVELVPVYVQTKRFDKALELLNSQIAHAPNNLHVYLLLSSIHEIMGNKSMAKTYHDKATKFVPGMEDIMNRRAMSLCYRAEELMSQHRLGEANVVLFEAYLIKPTFVPVLLDIGSIAAERGDLVGSEEYFNKAISLAPLTPSAHYNLSMTYELMGKSKQALEEMKKFRELDLAAKKKQIAPQ